MGWANGSQIADEVWGVVRGYIPPIKRKKVANEIIEIFEHEDADDWVDDQLIMEDAGRSYNEEEDF